MFDQVQDNCRKAAESTLQLQQEMFRYWTQQWVQVPDVSANGAGWAEQVGAFRKKWAQDVTDLLNKHRETLDAQYQAGIRIIEDAFRVGEARDPEQLLRLTEELWRQSCACLKAVVESQTRDFQAAVEKGFETMAQGPAAAQV